MSEAAERSRSHLSIGEVLSLLQGEFPDITISKIRFLESQGLLDPERTPSGYRKFYEQDINQLRWILQQQRENFLPLKVIKERLESGEVDVGAEVAQADGAAPGAKKPKTAPEAAAELDLPGSPPGSEPGSSATKPATKDAPAPKSAESERKASPSAGTSHVGELQEAPSPGRGAARAARDAVRKAPLDPGPASVALSREELAEAADISLAQVADLERFGILTGRTIGPSVLFDEEALGIARLAAGFLRYGVEGRHLRMYRVSAEREASFFQQVVTPMLRQRNPEARQGAVETLGELAELGEGLRAAMLHHALREYLGNG